MITALLFLLALVFLTLFGYRRIRYPLVRFMYLVHAAAVLLMLGIPSLWHAITGYENIGFLGFRFDSKAIEDVAEFARLAVTYTFGLTTLGFVQVSRWIGSRISVDHAGRAARFEPRYSLLAFMFLGSYLFFSSFYGSFSSVLMLRAREAVTQPQYIELLRGLVIAANTYAILAIVTTRLTRSPAPFILSSALFLFTLLLMIGFGSRNLLIYPMVAVALSFTLDNDPGLRRRNFLFGAALLCIFLFLAYVQSTLRDLGVGADGVNLKGGLMPLVVAFDQFSALCIALETSDSHLLGVDRFPMSTLFDMGLYFIPRSWFEFFDVAKPAHINWTNWNAYMVGAIQGNVTPSYVGQAFVEGGVVEVILLPLSITLIVAIFLRLTLWATRRTVNSLDSLTMIALCTGLFFNMVRMAAGIYALYFVAFLLLLFAAKATKRMLVRVR